MNALQAKADNYCKFYRRILTKTHSQNNFVKARPKHAAQKI